MLDSLSESTTGGIGIIAGESNALNEDINGVGHIFEIDQQLGRNYVENSSYLDIQKKTS